MTPAEAQAADPAPPATPKPSPAPCSPWPTSTRLGLVADDLRLSHAEVVAEAAARAAWLRATRRDGPFHVALMLDNVPEFVFWLEAAALAGAVVVGANPTHRGDELVRDLSHTECQFLVTDSTYLPLVEGARIGDALGDIGPDNERVLVLDTEAGARRPPPSPAQTRGRRRPIGDPRDARLPPLHLGNLRRAQGLPLQPGPAGRASARSWPRCTP